MNIKEALNARPDMQDLLFRRGFLYSEKIFAEKQNEFPFYGKWEDNDVAGAHGYKHNKCGFAKAEVNGVTFFLFGHCYNPFTMEHEEEKQLVRIGESLGKPDFWDKVAEITGVFCMGWKMANGDVNFITDPAGMQSTYFGVLNGNLLITSHPQVIGDLYDLKMDEIVKEIINYKWYNRVMGCYLPTDLSPFIEVKRVVPSILYTFHADSKTVTHKRFYPVEDLQMCKTQEEYQNVIEAAGDILKNGFDLVLKKWKRPAISLTGGIDSNGTFAAANGHYDKVETFSYLSAFKETIDVDAAKKIAGAFGIKHAVYEIPENKEDLPNFEIIKAIIAHNNGYIIERRDNEMRKRVYLTENLPYDCEVKSWVNETVRCYWFKHYGRKSFPKMSPKLYRNLYKMFFTNRSLAHKIDKLFETYMNDFEYYSIPKTYEPADVHFNEVTWGSWGGMNISEMKIYADIAIIYNNRKFIDLMLRCPIETRISDKCHVDMKKYLNEDLWKMGIRVVNMAETDSRARKANMVFTLNTILP